MRLDHGDYRACYTRMADDADFHAMSGDAFKLLWVLKLTLPTAGIGVVYPSMLCDQVGCDAARLEQLMQELEAVKPGGDLGWIVRDRNIVWVVKALASEPGMRHTSPNHRTNVHKTLQKLPERSPLVALFRRAYIEWFEKGLTEGSSRDLDSESESEETQNHSPHKGDAVDLEHPTDRHADDATGAADGSATASPAAQGAKTANGPEQTTLGTEARRFLRDCYGIRRGEPMTPRQKQVRADLHATLGPRGAVLERGVYVKAFNAQHLDDACTHVLGQKLKTPDAAIRLVLQFLQKTWQERKAAAEKAARGDDGRRAGPPTGPTQLTHLLTSAFSETEHAEAAEWFAGQSLEFRAAIERKAAAVVPQTKAPLVYERTLRGAICVAWREAGATEEATAGAA